MSYYPYRTAGASSPPPLTDKVRLYHVDMNPYGHRVLLILEAKNAKYEVYRLDPLNLPPWFKEKNPRLKIPVLEIPTQHGDKYLYESVVICDYLDEKYPRNQLHNRDPYDKAQDRLLIERFNEAALQQSQQHLIYDFLQIFINNNYSVFCKKYLKGQRPGAIPTFRINASSVLIKGSLECFDTNFAFGSEQIIQTLDIFENELARRRTIYFGGYNPGMLDYMIWPWVERLYLLRCVHERKFDEKQSLFPYMAKWGDNMQLDDVVKKHSSSPAEYFDYYKNARTHSMGYYL